MFREWWNGHNVTNKTVVTCEQNGDDTNKVELRERLARCGGVVPGAFYIATRCG
jgi:hypothetical protein